MDLSMHDDVDSMILLLGVTGAGKSYFASQLSSNPEDIKIGHKLRSETVKPRAYPCSIDCNKFLIIDTPGFDDTTRTDTEILADITEILSFQYVSKIKLKGVVFLHQITDNRMRGSSNKTFRMLEEIVGVENFSNVVLATTMWKSNTQDQPQEYVERECNLFNEFWGKMERQGSEITRFYGDKTSATFIVSSLLGKKDIVLAIQEETCIEEKQLRETSAGITLQAEVDAEIKKCNEKLEATRRNLSSMTNSSPKSASNRQKIRAQQSVEKEYLEFLRGHERDNNILNARIGKETKTKRRRFNRALKGAQLFGFLLGIASYIFSIVEGVCGGLLDIPHNL